MDYKVTIGLEIHAELKTKTKMFCDSKNDPEEKKPNVNICPVCMGHPGTLPVANKEAIKHVLKVGLALGAEIADFTEFDRKNYFYPDIPKGYQISQYKYPLIKGGSLSGVSVTRVHLEEDTAKSTHDNKNYSLVDYNRAGIPLMELVTEPVIHSAEDASKFAKEVQLLLQYLGVSDANMEKGEMRVEANLSISNDPNKLGTKVEVKNLNSFRSVERATAYEIERQKEILESGGKVVQETRGWDETKQVTFSQRLKEESHDYRYFPDPDLPKLKLSEVPEFSAENLKKEMPELPWEKRERYQKEFGLKSEDVEVYINNINIAKFFESAISGLSKEEYKLASNYITSDLIGLIKSTGVSFENSKLEPKSFSSLIKMINEGKLSSRGGKDLLVILFKEGGDPEKVAEEKGLIQKSNEEELKKIIESVIEKNPKVVADYKAGKESVLQFLIGMGMRETKGSANPAVLKKIFIDLLSK